MQTLQRAQPGRRVGAIPALPDRQRGIVAILATVSMLTLLGMTALAIDSGHAIWGKTRVQNALDAAALNAAKIVDDGGDRQTAIDAASAAFSATANGHGNSDLANALTASSANLVTQFSTTVQPFSPVGAGTAPFVRVTINNMPLPTFFMNALGMNQKTTSGSAVSGPSPALTGEACDIAPMMVCGDPPCVGTGCDPNSFLGYRLGDIHVLKYGSNSGEIGPGNFHLVRLDGNAGGSDIRDAMAGSYEGCLANGSSASADTEPGNTVGPSQQGLNHRFDQHQGPRPDYPFDQPDLNISYPNPTLNFNANTNTLTGSGQTIETAADLQAAYSQDYSYAGYRASYAANSNWSDPQYAANYQRRILTIPIVNCNGINNGQTQVPIYGFGCFFLIQPIATTGPAANRVVIGEFADKCSTSGSFTDNPPASGTGPFPTRIILYKDADRVDS